MPHNSKVTNRVVRKFVHACVSGWDWRTPFHSVNNGFPHCIFVLETESGEPYARVFVHAVAKFEAIFYQESRAQHFAQVLLALMRLLTRVLMFVFPTRSVWGTTRYPSLLRPSFTSPFAPNCWVNKQRETLFKIWC